jgi:hypothetical protein
LFELCISNLLLHRRTTQIDIHIQIMSFQSVTNLKEERNEIRKCERAKERKKERERKRKRASERTK